MFNLLESSNHEFESSKNIVLSSLRPWTKIVGRHEQVLLVAQLRNLKHKEKSAKVYVFLASFGLNFDMRGLKVAEFVQQKSKGFNHEIPSDQLVKLNRS